ncbi:hypothetical protein DSCW_22520 [Desulfosarcina widdelii]|uniref:Lipoprotein n=1 Tax=Desulfosarcina widdelii TaxID=947919 RepID=A0A5K7Z2B7_9BACT|nr:hypothetical protein [Desulfosarcina widdelii]BBO74835.1 hypothetical protein DSCW_22520 [Desulfosarcina widdelii]
MNVKTTRFYFVCMLAILLASALWATVTPAAESAGLDEATIKAYLEKKVIADPGSCLVENTKLNIIGIADLVPEHQAEAYYMFEYTLRCNRGSETKKGQGILNAVRLRNGSWIDRETMGIISK